MVRTEVLGAVFNVHPLPPKAVPRENSYMLCRSTLTRTPVVTWIAASVPLAQLAARAAGFIIMSVEIC